MTISYNEESLLHELLIAKNTTSLSVFKSSLANCNANPLFVTANNTTSLSAFNALLANCNANPLFVTAANTTSLSAFKSS